MLVKMLEKIMPAPSPCKPRKSISSVTSPSRPTERAGGQEDRHPRDDEPFPTVSPSLPMTGIIAVEASKYALVTQA